MGAFVRGEIVVLPFLSNLSTMAQKRPVLVLAQVGRYNDLIVCMITAKPAELSIEINEFDFDEGHLRNETSYVRPDRLFTAAPTLIDRRVAILKRSKMEEILNQVQQIFSVE